MTQEEILKIAEYVAKTVENYGDYYLLYSTSCIEFDKDNNATFTAYVSNCREENSDWEESWRISNNGEISYTTYGYDDDYYCGGDSYLSLEEFKERY